MKSIMEIETEHGVFTNNKITRQTAEQVYQEWLGNKDKAPIIEMPLQEKNRADIIYLSIMIGVDL